MRICCNIEADDKTEKFQVFRGQEHCGTIERW